MSDNFLGEIRVFSFDWPPKGWALCNGATMQIQQNAALYALLQTQFGGDGVKTFALPDLRGRTPVYGVGYQNVRYAGGAETVALGVDTLPPHIHALYATTNTATVPNALGNVLATVKPDTNNKTWPIYSGAAASVGLTGGSVASAGNNAPHNNMQPYTVVNFCIALSGLYPTRQ